MNPYLVETSYPISFRKEDSEKLGSLLKNRRSVVLVGMKRVGISNFLRFFLYHKEIKKHYVKDINQIFIPIDLNDLVELDIFPFWILTLKRISDYVEENIESEKVKKKVSQFFLDSIQSRDLFLTIDGIRKSLKLLTDEGYSPTIFFIRFDRIIEYATHAFFANFQGLIDATNHKLSFVFTSVRPLDTLSSEVFTKQALSVFADTLYIKPANKEDVKIVFDSLIKKYDIKLSSALESELLSLVDGYNQYLQFALIALHEEKPSEVTPSSPGKKVSNDKLLELLLSDERISLQSEELWESLSSDEQLVLKKILLNETLSSDDVKKGEYLYDTGAINNKKRLFSPLFEAFLHDKIISEKNENHTFELSKKEYVLLEFLKKNKNEVCEREEIIDHVWPEAEEVGVSDWAIDRLVARLRNKLKLQKSTSEIVTVKTRGYKLVE